MKIPVVLAFLACPASLRVTFPLPLKAREAIPGTILALYVRITYKNTHKPSGCDLRFRYIFCIAQKDQDKDVPPMTAEPRKGDISSINGIFSIDLLFS
jgi:hypothetical protein